MARPIPFDAPPRDVRQELMHRLDRAPAEHVAALLDAYELLQVLHDRKVLDTLRGLVGSGEAVLDIAVEEAKGPASIHAMRNMLVLFNMLGSIDPETFKKFTQQIPLTLQVESLQAHPPGLWGLMKKSIFNKEFRTGLGAMFGVIRGIGRGLSAHAKE